MSTVAINPPDIFLNIFDQNKQNILEIKAFYVQNEEKYKKCKKDLICALFCSKIGKVNTQKQAF